MDRYLLYLIAFFAIILALLPWYSSYLRLESTKAEENGDFVKSLHVAKQAVRVNPLSVEALFVLAGAQQRLGRETEARNALTEATRLQPLNYATWEVLALYERDRWGEQELAQEHLITAVGLNPFDEKLIEKAGIESIGEH